MAAKKKKQTQSRADRFWSAFLFTENGKPKSSTLLYTFCLSFVLLVVYGFCSYFAIEFLTKPLENVNTALANSLISIVAGLVGGAICNLGNLLFKDKRLVFGAHLWMLGYAVLVLIAMAFIMNEPDMAGWSGFWNFTKLAAWMAILPIVMGTVASWVICARAPKAETHEEEPEWKKYVSRR